MSTPDIETHPFEPFLPKTAQLLMLGTFPPSPKRWCMDWYYPNYTNDMWRIMGLCFFGDKLHFVDEANKTYRLDALKSFLSERGIAIFDTCLRVKRRGLHRTKTWKWWSRRTLMVCSRRCHFVMACSPQVDLPQKSSWNIMELAKRPST